MNDKMEKVIINDSAFNKIKNIPELFEKYPNINVLQYVLENSKHDCRVLAELGKLGLSIIEVTMEGYSHGDKWKIFWMITIENENSFKMSSLESYEIFKRINNKSVGFLDKRIKPNDEIGILELNLNLTYDENREMFINTANNFINQNIDNYDIIVWRGMSN